MKEFLKSANVHVLHPQSKPLAGFLRVGHTGHKKLEAMLAAGRFPYKRVVFDAAHGVNVVLAPTHLIEKADDSWRAIDIELCSELRHELDRLGSENIDDDRYWRSSNF